MPNTQPYLQERFHTHRYVEEVRFEREGGQLLWREEATFDREIDPEYDPVEGTPDMIRLVWRTPTHFGHITEWNLADFHLGSNLRGQRSRAEACCAALQAQLSQDFTCPACLTARHWAGEMGWVCEGEF